MFNKISFTSALLVYLPIVDSYYPTLFYSNFELYSDEEGVVRLHYDRSTPEILCWFGSVHCRHSSTTFDVSRMTVIVVTMRMQSVDLCSVWCSSSNAPRPTMWKFVEIVETPGGQLPSTNQMRQSVGDVVGAKCCSIQANKAADCLFAALDSGTSAPCCNCNGKLAARVQLCVHKHGLLRRMRLSK